MMMKKEFFFIVFFFRIVFVYICEYMCECVCFVCRFGFDNPRFVVSEKSGKRHNFVLQQHQQQQQH